MNELEGTELDEAVARVLGVEPGAAYSTDWTHGGPLIDRFAIHLSGPEARVHRNGGPNAGWGQSGAWTCTSWQIRKADGHRAIGWQAQQAKDDGLWFDAVHVTEDYLQRALRALAAVVEGSNARANLTDTAR